MIIILVSLTIGLLALWIGLNVRLGKYKRWWLLESTPVVPIQTFIVAIPIGILFLLFPMLIIVDNPSLRGEIALILIAPALIIIVLLSIWQPNWLLPKWLRWLTNNHQKILPTLRMEAKSMGGRNWEKAVVTQEGLESWVAEVCEKNNL